MKKNITVPTEYVQQLLAQVAEQKYDTDALLASVGIAPAEIQNQTSFSAEKFGALYQHVMYITQDEYFGLLSGGCLPRGSFRMMCHAIIQCKNMEHAINRASDFHEIVRGIKIKPILTRNRTSAQVSFTGVDRLEDSQFNTLLSAETPTHVSTSLSMWHHFISWLIGKRVELKSVDFAFSEKDAEPNYAKRFQTKIKFDQAENSFSFPSRYLEYPIVQTEKTLRGFLKTAPYQLLVMVDDSVSLKSQVISLIGRDFSITPPSAEDVAKSLNMSLSTLRRRLLAEDTTFQEIKDECRKQSAIKYMASPQLSINDVAELMGFDVPSAFFRSFKRWTGMTPGEYRQQGLHDII